ncbi:5-formyltetrahydrofolate cyclo-ligase, mitochondrial [Impatiens glandulifera]|uniref:5-formyltetrahydrofolate cyclo-ligase, mitochondrial n=1 Tax=Impatiens glandulifera TaxID=253017 RepID=UPI001FB0AECA|nr:5-formyltetrahydrofolate cyclo-ligase, mitochondrial [Impatiens glandulifera]
MGGLHSLVSSSTIPQLISLSRSVILRRRRCLLPESIRSSSSPSYTISTMSNDKNHTDDVFATVSDLDHVFKQKKSLRSIVKKELKDMDLSQRLDEDRLIQQIVLEAPWFKSSKRLCAYISCKPLREVDTSIILSEILQNPLYGEKKLYVPRVEDKNRNMRMLNISSIDDLVANSMNILEPLPIDAEGVDREDVMLANEPVDLLLLPGLAFEKSGKRLGRGGGYYDTFLSKYLERAKENKWKQPLLVALSYSRQIMEEGVIPVTSTDVSVDALVTPTGVVPISSIALEEMCI